MFLLIMFEFFVDFGIGNNDCWDFFINLLCFFFCSIVLLVFFFSIVIFVFVDFCIVFCFSLV